MSLLLLEAIVAGVLLPRVDDLPPTLRRGAWERRGEPGWLPGAGVLLAPFALFFSFGSSSLAGELAVVEVLLAAALLLALLGCAEMMPALPPSSPNKRAMSRRLLAASAILLAASVISLVAREALSSSLATDS